MKRKQDGASVFYARLRKRLCKLTPFPAGRPTRAHLSSESESRTVTLALRVDEMWDAVCSSLTHVWLILIRSRLRSVEFLLVYFECGFKSLDFRSHFFRFRAISVPTRLYTNFWFSSKLAKIGHIFGYTVNADSIHGPVRSTILETCGYTIAATVEVTRIFPSSMVSAAFPV